MSPASPSDPASPDRLVDHLPMLRRFARSLTRDPATAEDLVQDVVVRAIERRAGFHVGGDLGAWLLALTHNLFIDGWRRDRTGRAARHALALDAARATAPAQDHAVELALALRRFEALPDDQRVVMHLVAIEGASYAAAASILGVPVGTVMSRLNRARTAMRAPSGRSVAPSRLKLVGGRDD